MVKQNPVICPHAFAWKYDEPAVDELTEVKDMDEVRNVIHISLVAGVSNAETGNRDDRY